MKLWHERRFYSIDSYLKTTYGRKLYKIALDGGMSCPNRDGTVGTGGCIFCSAGGSGDFAADRRFSITKQIEIGKQQTSKKFSPKNSNSHTKNDMQVDGISDICDITSPSYIAYFQAYTNTYASPEYLRKIFMEAALNPDIVLLSIATRPDCLGEDVIEVLTEIQAVKPVWIELGLQTIHKKTADFINRGYSLSRFEEAVQKLHMHNIPVIVHMILGLPDERRDHMFETLDYICSFSVFGLKLQLLHILKNTKLANLYQEHPFPVLSKEEYVSLIVDMLERTPDTITIHRLTGDAPRNILIAPDWSLHKRQVLNDIAHLMKERDTWQGKARKL